jgi:hypothetical protein
MGLAMGAAAKQPVTSTVRAGFIKNTGECMSCVKLKELVPECLPSPDWRIVDPCRGQWAWFDNQRSGDSVQTPLALSFLFQPAGAGSIQFV